jgi:hypothetical protein
MVAWSVRQLLERYERERVSIPAIHPEGTD